MAKLSEAGALYLKDYYILTEAREEMESFLDKVLLAVHLKLEGMVEGLTDETTKWSEWKSQSPMGYMQIGVQVLQGEFGGSRKGRSDVFVEYRDVRHTTRIEDPLSVEIGVAVHAQSKLLGQEIERRSLNMLGSNIIGYQYPGLIPESSDESADNVFETIQDICMKLKKIIDAIVAEN